eukprot:TRINITY_DN22751_c2_g2_i1.p1 TRINITY_DN22751_c2_g2~~TRINITY_DN22751_c2_g2_i1.p1  ORF type:complete len:543 (-),score=49.05 TRINITY_DN22751_c2_g2_i1:732-2177(-)
MSAAFGRPTVLSGATNSAKPVACQSSQQQQQQQQQQQAMTYSMAVGSSRAVSSQMLFSEKKKVLESTYKRASFLDNNNALMFDLELESSKQHRQMPRRLSEESLSNLTPQHIQTFQYQPYGTKSENYIRLLTHPHSKHEYRLRQLFTNPNLQPYSLTELQRHLEQQGFEIELVSEQNCSTHENKSSNNNNHGVNTVCYPHAYLQCRGFRGQETDIVIDPCFQQQFEIATTSTRPEYQRMLQSLPKVFIGTKSRLKRVVEEVCKSMSESFCKCRLPLPPWRSRINMLAKWQLQEELEEGVFKRGKERERTNSQFGEKMKELVKFDQEREFARFSEFASSVKLKGLQQCQNCKPSPVHNLADGYEGDVECEPEIVRLNSNLLQNVNAHIKQGALSFALKQSAERNDARSPPSPDTSTSALFMSSVKKAVQIQKNSSNNGSSSISATTTIGTSKSLLSCAVKKLLKDGKSPNSVLDHQPQERGN